MNDKILPYLKSYAALFGAIATALLAVYGPDTEVGRVLTVLSVIATAVVTWAVPNKDPLAQHQDESVQPAEGGSSEVVTVLVVLVAVLLVLLVIGAVPLGR